MPSNLNESISKNDLSNHVDNIASIDQYKSKLGDDKNVIVIAIKIKDRNPAMDLSQFLETGLDLIDVEPSPGPDEDGFYKLYIEISRDSKSGKKIQRILDDVQRVDNAIENWLFTSYNDKNPKPWSLEAFNAAVETDAYEYEIKHNPKAEEITEKKAISDRLKFLKDY